MRCPVCGSENVYVLETRNGEDGRTIIRRRECSGCLAKFKTTELITELKPFREYQYKRMGRRPYGE